MIIIFMNCLNVKQDIYFVVSNHPRDLSGDRVLSRRYRNFVTQTKSGPCSYLSYIRHYFSLACHILGLIREPQQKNISFFPLF